MIHIFFTYAAIDNENNFSAEFCNLLGIKTEDFDENVLQIYFDNGIKPKVIEVTDDESFLLKNEDDCIILIHDKCIVNSDYVFFTDSGEEYKYFSKTQFKAFLKYSNSTECAIYFHNNGLEKHKEFADWKSEIKDVIFYYKENGDTGTLKSFSHIPDSPFHKLLTILQSQNKEGFTERLLKLKEESFGSEEEIEEKNLLNQKLTLLHKLLGNQNLEPEEDELAKETLPDYKNEIKKDKIEGIRILRDELLKEY